MPRFYLRGFGDTGDRLRTFDKTLSRELTLAIGDATVVTDYHTIAVQGLAPDAIEGSLSELEAVLAPALAAVVSEPFPPNESVRIDVAIFLSFQFLRVPRLRAIWESEAGRHLVDHFSAFAADIERDPERLQELHREAMPDASAEQLTEVLWIAKSGAIEVQLRTEQYLDGMLASIIPLAQHLAARPWRLVTAVEGAEFLVSDSPVTAMAYDLSGGLLKADFVTAPIDRRHALILGPTGRDDQAALNYGPAEAVGINGATFGSAARWVYAHPESANNTFDRAAEEWTRATSP